MKNLFLISLTLLLMNQKTNAQTWTPMSVGSAAEVMYMSFPTDDTGYVSMGNGTLRKTTNGALNWTQCNVMNALQSDVEFVSGTRGFMFANTGVVMTTDGAQTWNYVVSDPNITFFDICFADAQVGYVSAINNNLDTTFIFKTIDGGTTWNPMPVIAGQFNTFEPRMYFYSATVGFICIEDYRIFKTTDGGLTWNQVYQDISSTGDMFLSMHSPDGQNYFEGGYYNTLVASTDGGDNWTPGTIVTFPMYGLYFTNPLHGFYCGGDGLSSGAIEETNDGGVTWNSVYTGNTLWCMDFPSPTVGYAAGKNGVIVKYNGLMSVPESSFSLISCYPNPASDFLMIENIAVGSVITITNSLGQIVLEQTAIDDRMRIDVSELAEGMYVVQYDSSSPSELLIAR